MTAWGVRCEIPLRELGRVRLPRTRIRYRDGWVRLGYNALRTRIVATLVDREDRAIPMPTQAEACAKAALMGRVIAFHLMRYNHYEPGEPAGDRNQVRVALA
jgi:hypothetical protein